MTGDSTAAIRVIVDPPEAHTSSLSLVLYRVRRDGSASLFREPPFGVDSLPNLPSGLYRLRVRQIGYSPPQDTIRIERGEAWCVVAHFVRDTIQLKQIY